MLAGETSAINAHLSLHLRLTSLFSAFYTVGECYFFPLYIYITDIYFLFSTQLVFPRVSAPLGMRFVILKLPQGSKESEDP